MKQQERINLSDLFIQWLVINEYHFDVTYVEGKVNHIEVTHWTGRTRDEVRLKKLYFMFDCQSQEESKVCLVINFKDEDHLFIEMKNLRELEIYINEHLN